MLARVARRGAAGLSMEEAVAETGWPRERVDQLAAVLKQAKTVVQAGEVLLSAEEFVRARNSALAIIEAFHKTNPLVAGLNQEQLREQLGLRPEVYRAVVASLVSEKKVEIAGEQVRGAGRGVVLRDDEAESKQKIEQAFAKAGLQVPLLKEVLASLRIDQVRAQKIVTLLLRDRVLVKAGR